MILKIVIRSEELGWHRFARDQLLEFLIQKLQQIGLGKQG
jgi:hypothetical protein